MRHPSDAVLGTRSALYHSLVDSSHPVVVVLTSAPTIGVLLLRAGAWFGIQFGLIRGVEWALLLDYRPGQQ
jgi:hypothetical protein